MATSSGSRIDVKALTQSAHVLGASLVVLAGLAVGTASVVNGSIPGLRTRLPVYALTGAVVFIGALLAMRNSPREKSSVLGRASLAGVLGFVVVALGNEAMIYTFIVLAPDLSLYVASVVVVSCGLVYWSVRDWYDVDDLTRPW
jgi:hypothetical protein